MLFVTQARGPVATRGPCAARAADPTDLLHQHAEGRAQVTGGHRREISVGRDRAGRVDEVDDGGVWEAAIGEPEVERGAGHDDQIGLPERNRTGPGEAQQVVSWEQAPAHIVRERRERHSLDERARLGFRAGPVDVAADQQYGTFRGHQQFGDSGDRLRIGCLAHHLGGPDRRGHRRIGRTPAIQRDINKGGAAMRRARCARSAQSKAPETSSAVNAVAACLVTGATSGT